MPLPSLKQAFQYHQRRLSLNPMRFPQQYQELTILQGHILWNWFHTWMRPHISFILKHPEYSGIRLYPNNNYELSVIDPRSINLMKEHVW
jgi:hypothetical protein